MDDEQDPSASGGGPDPQVTRLADPAGVQTETWSRVLEEMDALIDDRHEDGWDVLRVVAAHTDVITKDMGEHDRFGIQHILPDNHADEFVEFYDDAAFTQYLVYGRDVQRYMYLVTELIDPENERSVMVAGRYDVMLAEGVVENAREEGALYTQFKRINGTLVGRYEHEEWEPMVAPLLEE